jgi:hypothetical protein
MQSTQIAPELGTPEPDQVCQLLTALGDWGVAEELGEPAQVLDFYADRAYDAYRLLAHAA